MADPHPPRPVPRDFFLPDFCSGPVVLVVVLVAELTAFVLTIARHLPEEGAPLWLDLARLSLFLQWIGLTSAAVLCLARRYLTGIAPRWAALASFLLLLATTGVLSEIAYQLAAHTGLGETLLPASHGGFVVRNLIVCAIVSVLLLRYFYVQHQWKRHVQHQARARIEALQARIRPHFLFNSMNTIAALIRSRPDLAERTVEDLAELFRASLSDGRNDVTLGEEMLMARQYQRIEELRLGERLQVAWHTDELPADARVPRLLLQPLLENAIYHGIEPQDAGGTVTVRGRRRQDQISIEIGNPLPPASAPRRHGHQMALDNVRERLRLAWPERADLETHADADSFRVELHFPYERVPP